MSCIYYQLLHGCDCCCVLWEFCLLSPDNLSAMQTVLNVNCTGWHRKRGTFHFYSVHYVCHICVESYYVCTAYVNTVFSVCYMHCSD